MSVRIYERRHATSGSWVVPGRSGGVTPPPPSTGLTLLNSTMDTLTVANPISNANMWAAMGATVGGTSTFARTSVVAESGHGNVLRQLCPAGVVGGGSGISMFPPLSQAVEEATISYDVRMVGTSHDFGWGGKLPGLGGVLPGQGNPPTGGSPSPYGWTCRGMWIEPAAGYASQSPLVHEWIGYIYEPTQTAGTYGSNRRTRKTFVPDQWHRVQQSYAMNSVSVEGGSAPPANGLHRMFFDGVKCWENSSQVYRLYTDAMITHMAWSIFYGGATTAWAPATDQYIEIDNLVITTGVLS